MKKYFAAPGILLCAALLEMTLASCNKEAATNPYYISFKADSISFIFKQDLEFYEADQNPIYECIISGEGVNGRIIRLSVTDTMPISPRSYAWGASDDTTFIPAFAYYLAQGKPYTSFSHDSTYVIINFSAISDSTASGTFTGRLDLTGKGSVMINDGEFFVKRVN
jgi:hypothetical protein